MDKHLKQPGPPSGEICSSIYPTLTLISATSEVFSERGHFKVFCKFQKVATFSPQFEWESALARSSLIRQGSDQAGLRHVEQPANDLFIFRDLGLFRPLWLEIRS